MAGIFSNASAGATAGKNRFNLGIPKLALGINLGTGNSSGASGGGSSDSGMSDTEALNGFIDEMYQTFLPDEIVYNARGEEEIGAEIAAWLRPGYDQAIENRREQTLTYQAQADADAIARGMGASTYVSDVKARQMKDESRDIASLESDYGAALAKYVSEGFESDNARALEVQLFNAQQRQDAYDLAYGAALKLFDLYKKSGASRSGGSGKSTSAVTATTAENCDLFLSLLDGRQRKEVYEAASAEGARYRAEILASVGYQGYIALRQKYPEAN